MRLTCLPIVTGDLQVITSIRDFQHQLLLMFTNAIMYNTESEYVFVSLCLFLSSCLDYSYNCAKDMCRETMAILKKCHCCNMALGLRDHSVFARLSRPVVARSRASRLTRVVRAPCPPLRSLSPPETRRKAGTLAASHVFPLLLHLVSQDAAEATPK